VDTAQDFIELLVDSTTGELFYFLAVFVASQAALLMALDQRLRYRHEPAAKRYSVALAGVTLAWLVLMFGAWLEIVVNDPLQGVLPPLERAVNAVVLVFWGWTLLTADRQKDHDAAVVSILLILILLAGFGYTQLNWDTSEDFNQQTFSFSWTFIPLLLSLLGIFLLLTRYKRTADVPLKLMIFVVIGAGHFVTLMRIVADDLAGDAAGAVRWVYLMGSFIGLAIVYRMIIERMTVAVEEAAVFSAQNGRAVGGPALAPAAPEPDVEFEQLARKVSRDSAAVASVGGRNEALDILIALGVMLDHDDTNAIPEQIVKAVAQSLRADIVVITACEDDNWADIAAAYNGAYKRPIEAMKSINLSDQPTMREVIATKRRQMLSVDQTSNEIRELYTRFDMGQGQVGPTYLQPLTRNTKVVGMLIVGFPYTGRQMNVDELRLMESLAPIASRLLVMNRQAARRQAIAEERAIEAILQNKPLETVTDSELLDARKSMQASLDMAQQQISDLTRLVRDLQLELDDERSRVAQLLEDGEDAMSITQRIDVLSKERDELQQERQKLASALHEAQATLAGVTAEDDVTVYQALVEVMQNEYNILQAQKNNLERQLNQFRSSDSPARDQLHEMIQTLGEDKASIVAERDNLSRQLEEVKSQLDTRGIEGGVVGLTKQIAQLTEERDKYKSQAEKAMLDRQMLVQEWQKYEGVLSGEKERESRIKELEDQIARLMEDREALAKSRDGFKHELESVQGTVQQMQADRARILADHDAVKIELDEVADLLSKVNEQRQELAAQRNQLEAQTDSLKAQLARTQNDYNTLLARLEGDRDRLQTVGEEGVGALTAMVDNLTKERSSLEERLLAVEQEADTLRRELARRSSEAPVITRTPDSAESMLALAKDLRTSLTVMTSYVDMLLSESMGKLETMQHQFLSRIKTNVTHLGQLANDIVKVYRLGSGQYNLQPQKINLIDVIDDAVTLCHREFGEKNIILDMDITTDELMIEADTDALRQIVTRLLENAYLTSPPQGSVRIVARHEASFELPVEANGGQKAVKDVAYVALSDQGGGLSLEEQKQVFSTLYRPQSGLDKGEEEPGIGLSVVKAFVEAHGGTIWVESEVGVGSTFKLVLPVKHPASAPPDAEKLPDRETR
jgi:signal transduction histidine kinase